jgi:hypothetical protein
VAQRCGQLERHDLGVVALVVVVRAFAEDGLAACDYAADGRIWRGQTESFVREVECAGEKAFVMVRERHQTSA